MSTRLLKKIQRIIREEGFEALVRKAGQRLLMDLGLAPRGTKSSIDFLRTVDLPSQPSNRGSLSAPLRSDGKMVINWLMPDAGRGSGGHTTIMRMVKHLESFGHQNRIYLTGAGYMGDPRHHTPEEAKKFFDTAFFPTNAEFYLHLKDVRDCDALIATAWWNAYQITQINNCRRRFYFVQDFEPFFYPVDTNYLLAERSYQLGHYHITIGSWLSEKLPKEYGARADWYPFAYDREVYSPKSKVVRDGKFRIFFYARPVTPRRCFELGVKGIEIFLESVGMKNVEVVMAGWDLGNYSVPFPYIDRGVVSPQELAEIYRETDVAMVFSATNPSLIPFEVAGSERVVMDLDLPNVRSVLTHKENAYLVTPLPKAVADGLLDLYRHPELRTTLAKSAYESVENLSWEDSAKKLEAILLRELFP
ncbi:MAG: glycosyltransferase family 4 protein [Parcubacteria group bacterium]|nr:glycosyltransferase family 4 protein [Parcubacteria group bacterium]